MLKIKDTPTAYITFKKADVSLVKVDLYYKAIYFHLFPKMSHVANEIVKEISKLTIWSWNGVSIDFLQAQADAGACESPDQ